METRAAHILVGSFVLVFLLGAVGFAVWLAKTDFDKQYNEYDIFFESSVLGLYPRSNVFFMGIPVGDVREITVDETDSSRVRVHIRMDGKIPVSEGATAQLEYQGLTGVGYVEITGGREGAPLIVAKDGEVRPVIPAGESALQALFTQTPTLLEAAIKAVVQIQKLLSEDNIALVQATLEKASAVAGNLDAGTRNLDTLVGEVNDAITEIKSAAANLGQTAETADAFLQDDVRKIASDMGALMERSNTLVERLDSLVAANQEPVTLFTNNSLPEVSRMITDLRKTSQALSRLMQRLEQNPSEVIFGRETKEFDLESRKLEGGK